MPLPITTTRSTARSYGKSIVTTTLESRRGVIDTVTAPWTRAQQAIRLCAGSRPSRSSVACSSPATGERFSIPATTHTGSAPQTPIRQPASIGWSACSASSSSGVPCLATIRGPPSSNVTSASRAVRRAARAPSPSRAARGGVGSPLRSRNTRSFANVRRSQTTVSASTAARSGHAIQSGPGAAHQ